MLVNSSVQQNDYIFQDGAEDEHEGYDEKQIDGLDVRNLGQLKYNGKKEISKFLWLSSWNEREKGF